MNMSPDWDTRHLEGRDDDDYDDDDFEAEESAKERRENPTNRWGEDIEDLSCN